MNEYEFMGCCHLLTISTKNEIPFPKELPDCLNVIVLKRIVGDVCLNYESLNYAILNQNKNQIEKIVKENKDSINKEDDTLQHAKIKPIEMAISLSDPSTVQCLIDNGANMGHKQMLFYALKQRKHEMAMYLFNQTTDFIDGMSFIVYIVRVCIL